MTLIVDPPSGWQYGFPKAVPEDWKNYSDEERELWFLEQGYPQSMIDNGSLNRCRMWMEKNED